MSQEDLVLAMQKVIKLQSIALAFSQDPCPPISLESCSNTTCDVCRQEYMAQELAKIDKGIK